MLENTSKCAMLWSSKLINVVQGLFFGLCHLFSINKPT